MGIYKTNMAARPKQDDMNLTFLFAGIGFVAVAGILYYFTSKAEEEEVPEVQEKSAPVASAPVHQDRKRKKGKNTVAQEPAKVEEAPKSPVKETVKEPEPVQNKKKGSKKNSNAAKEPEPVKQQPETQKNKKKKNNKKKNQVKEEVEEPTTVLDNDDGEEWVTVSKKAKTGKDTQKKGRNDDYLELF